MHDKPATLNPIPVGTRIMVIRCRRWPGMVGATGVIVGEYRMWKVDGLRRYAYLVDLHRHRHPSGKPWAAAHGQIVPIAPPDDVILESTHELEAA